MDTHRHTMTDRSITDDFTILRYNLCKGEFRNRECYRVGMNYRIEWRIKSKMGGKVIEKEGSVNGCRFIVHRLYDVNRRVGKHIVGKGVTYSVG